MMLGQPYIPPEPSHIQEDVEHKEQSLRRDFTTPIPVLYIVASIAVVLILIVAILGASVFHFW